MPILKFIFWEEICPISEKQTCNGAYGLSASRKENQGKETEWWFEAGVVFFRAGLSQWGDIWADREMRCRGQSLSFEDTAQEAESPANAESKLGAQFLSEEFGRRSVWQEQNGQAESGRRWGQRERNFYAMRRILFCDRKSLGKSEHTSDMNWKFWKDYSYHCVEAGP